MAEVMINPFLGKVLEEGQGFRWVVQVIEEPIPNPSQEGKSGVVMRGEGNG